jgi:hypothetical protein
MKRRLPLLVLLALAWLAATGEVGVCKLFRPASPETGGTSSLVLTNYTQPDSTLATMARGIKAKVNGTDAYLGGIADTSRDGRAFRAGFDPAIVARYTSQAGSLPIPDPWSTDLERTFFFNFVQYRSTPYTMTWAPDPANPLDDLGPDAAVIHRAYLVTTHQDDGTDPTIAVGFADLFFVRTAAGRWVIVGWGDRVDPAAGGANPSDPEKVCFGWRRLNLR